MQRVEFQCAELSEVWIRGLLLTTQTLAMARSMYNIRLYYQALALSFIQLLRIWSGKDQNTMNVRSQLQKKSHCISWILKSKECKCIFEQDNVSLYFRIEHLGRWCKHLKILYLQSNLISKIGKRVTIQAIILFYICFN